MFIAFVLILLFILLGVLVGVYSVFAPFTQNIGDVIDFNSAYYGALAGIERANLVLKYRSPGFEGSGWYFGATSYWPKSDLMTGLWNLNNGNNWVSWQIKSRTTNIPSSGDGNVEYLLSSSDSNNFNELPYYTPWKVYLYIDNTPSDRSAYSWITTFSYFTWWVFSGYFRLPSKVITNFGGSLLCETCDSNWDLVKDEVAVNRWLDGYYNWTQFSILPNEEIFYSSWRQIDTTKDTVLRESIVNNSSGALYFGNTESHGWYNFSPILQYHNTLTSHNLISTDPSVIKNMTFKQILTNTDINPQVTWLEFSFGLVDLLRSANGNIYPFLEYQLSFPSPVSNNFYTLEWESVVWNYDVKIIMKKWTNPDSTIGNFTIIF